MPGVLDGIRVTGITVYAAMPATCAILGDWGAEVIKIENPAGGDPLRWITPQSNGLTPCPVMTCWEQDDRNQMSIALDLTKEVGRQVAYRLIKSSDVFVANLQESSLTKFGMDYDTLSQLNPMLIYAHFNGYGGKGPDKEKPGFDQAAFWATSGLMATLGEPDGPPPIQRPAMGDHTAGIANAAGIVAALYARERYGFGQKVECCLMSVGMWVNSYQIVTSLVNGLDIPKLSRKNQSNPIRNVYRCRNDRWIQIIVPLNTDRVWPGFCRALGIENLIHDPRFENEKKRAQNCQELIAILDDAIVTRDIEYLKKAFDEAGVIWAQVNTVKEIANSPQALANDFIREVNHLELGKIKLVASPLTFSKTPSTVRTPAPRLGEHTEAILNGIGYSSDEIAKLRQEKIIL